MVVEACCFTCSEGGQAGNGLKRSGNDVEEIEVYLDLLSAVMPNFSCEG